METKRRKAKRRKIDPHTSTVTLLDLDQNLSQICELAQIRPITVYRYRKPYAVIISLDAWIGAAKLDDYVVAHSPLARVHRAIEPALHAYAPLIKRIGLRRRLNIDSVQVVRVLMLQALYSIPSEGALRDKIISDIEFRWFVGLGVNSAVWESSALSKAMRALLGDEELVEIVLELMQMAMPAVMQLESNFQVNVALVQSWALRHPRLEKRVPIRAWRAVRLFLAPVDE